MICSALVLPWIVCKLTDFHANLIPILSVSISAEPSRKEKARGFVPMKIKGPALMHFDARHIRGEHGVLPLLFFVALLTCDDDDEAHAPSLLDLQLLQLYCCWGNGFTAH